jgi:hypothetical protein
MNEGNLVNYKFPLGDFYCDQIMDIYQHMNFFT